MSKKEAGATILNADVEVHKSAKPTSSGAPPHHAGQEGQVERSQAIPDRDLPDIPPPETQAPPGVQAAPPRGYLGFVPTNINQVLANLGPKATHFTGAVVSGGVPGSVFCDGSALCCLLLQVDYTMGTFSLPVVFPQASILLWCATMVLVPFAGGADDATVALGRTLSGSEILAAQDMGALYALTVEPVTGTLGLPTDANPYQCYVTFNSEGNTSGQGFVVLMYARSWATWN
ncbi:MAG TPA: hypothetical protein VI455_04175 [Terriglobia bacterium]